MIIDAVESRRNEWNTITALPEIETCKMLLLHLT